MITQKKAEHNIVGGKTARACESCLKKRASWFCPADHAFLCNACDLSIHSAHELAGRHKRVRLETASSKPNPHTAVPSWHQGFTKKARTPRNTKASKSLYGSQMPHVVPQVSNDHDNEEFVEEDNEENEVVFSVPSFDSKNDDGFNISLIGFDGDMWDNMPGFLPTETELAEFGDVESLLEQENDEVVKMDDLIFNLDHGCFPEVKIEEEGEISISTSNNNNNHCYFDWSNDVESQMLNFDLNYGVEEEEELEKNVVVPKEENYYEESNNNNEINLEESNYKRRKILLRLNYEEVINAWASLGCSSPWTTGRRPEFDLDHDGWPNCMGALGPTGNVKGDNEGREARVLRYREKRRTRLFSKKIRYQVRKLNAEKRPRFKGRFVKLSSLLSPLV
ncbi:unnamed protein product [Amaranthus hypochondriacus]